MYYNIILKYLNLKKFSYKNFLFFIKNIYKKKVSIIYIICFIISLKIKKENIYDIYYIIKILKKYSLKFKLNKKFNLTDIVGTGGNNSNIINVSTASMFIISSINVNILKHGSSFFSSISGSSDVLKKLNININLNKNKIIYLLNKIGICFIYSKKYNILMNILSYIRKKIKIRTIFNIIGPLINPIYTKNIYLGVYNKNILKIKIKILKKNNFYHAICVSGNNIDEATINDYSYLYELKKNKILNFKIHPNDFKIKKYELESIKIKNSFDSKNKILKVFNGYISPYYYIILYNSSILLYVSNKVNFINKSIKITKNIINSYNINNKINKFIKISNL
ncbi:putative anthranilate phosphoribosyltransferase [Candidatus Zinderia insecticola CARI]|uniref:Putative anthranilate phosphoribosyltransferase n=1 Tax=Zinderia insecticola (strain CARI) TaxID=871271 RepID=E0TIM2_ZINIC|nr:putative anthranilate phosphoribosyltransferase [Candidatus Zinderia insecticola CARI]